MAATDPDRLGESADRVALIGTAILLTVAVIYAYHGWNTATHGYVVLAAVLLGAVGVYVTSYWRPMLYLVLALGLAVESVRSILDGSWRHLPISIAVVLDLVFVFVAVYLFYETERARESAGAR